MLDIIARIKRHLYSGLSSTKSGNGQGHAFPFTFRVYAVYEVDGKQTGKELHRLIDTRKFRS